MMPYAPLLLIALLSACAAPQEEATLSRYPDAYRSATVLTFETEVVRGDELEDITSALRRRGINATFFVVAGYFESTPEVLEPLRGFEVASMAWSQPEWVNATLSERRRQMLRAHAWFLEHGFNVTGFRAPYLKASRRTLELVAELGYTYDSSLSYGFEPYPVNGILELPVSTNFDPFWDEEKMKITLPVAYLTFQRAYDTGGVFILLTHVHTSHRYLENLTAFLDYMMERRVWFPSARELADWWLLRENLRLSTAGDTLILENLNARPVKGATAILRAKSAEGAVETWRDPVSGELYVVFPEVPPGGTVSIKVER